MLLILTTLSLLTLETHGVLGFWGIKINYPSADPFTSPIALKVEVVARDFNL